MPDIGQTNQSLITGRIAYGFDGTNAYPIKVNSTGNIITGASTANIGDVDVLNIETIQTELLAATTIAASAQATSSVLSVVGVKKALVFIDHGRASTASFGTNGTEYRVEVSQQASNNDTWRPIASVMASSVVCSSSLTGTTLSAGTTVVAMTTATTFAVGDIVFFANTTTPTAHEWATIVSVSGTANFTIHDGLTNNIAAGTAQAIFNKAEHFALNLDVAACTRLRVAVNNNASGTTNAMYARIACITEK